MLSETWIQIKYEYGCNFLQLSGCNFDDSAADAIRGAPGLIARQLASEPMTIRAHPAHSFGPGATCKYRKLTTVESSGVV